MTDKTHVDAAAAYRAAIETSTDGFWLSDAEGRILEVNDAYVKRSGYTREELLIMHITDLEARESPEETARHIGKISREGRDTFETLHRTKDGTIWHVEVNAAYWKIGGGLFFNFLRDITSRKQSEETLRVSEERYRRIIEYSPISVAVVGLDGVIEYINRKARETFGYAPEDIPDMERWWVQAYPDEVYRQEVISSWMGQVYQAFADNSEIKGNEYRVTCKDGTVKTMLISGVPVGDKLLVLFNDITERKRAEVELENHRNHLEELVTKRTEELSHLNDLLRQSQKLEAVGLLAGGIAHDFSNILTTIKGAAYILNKSIDRNSPQVIYADQILKSIERGADLAQSLLAFSRKQTITLLPLNINELLHDSLPLLGRLVGESIEIVMEPGDDIPVIMADRNQLQQVLINLASNAGYAMPGGGTITLRTGLVGIDETAKMNMGFGAAGPYVMLQVVDTGTGIGEDIREKIFEPFFTTKELGQGTGLGLAVTYGIVKQHNGFILFDPVSSGGASFRIYFPVAGRQEYAGNSQKVSAVTPGAGEKGGTILLAEDDDGARRITADILAMEGYDVLEAKDGEEALRLFAGRMHDIDLALLDVRMPKKNGREVYDEIKRLRPGAVILFVSGYTEDIISSEGILCEGLNFVPKSAAPEVLLEKIRQLIAADQKS